MLVSPVKKTAKETKGQITHWNLLLVLKIWQYDFGSFPTLKTLKIFFSSAEFLQPVVHDFVLFLYVAGVF